MARQSGDIKISGTIDGLCFYRMEGAFYVRRKSSLTGKRFRKDPVFAPSRRSASLLQIASPLASALYRQLPAAQKGRPVFQALTGAVKKMLAEGQTETAILSWFARTYLPLPPVAKKPAAATGRPATRPPLLPGLLQRHCPGQSTWPGRPRLSRKRARRLAHYRPPPLQQPPAGAG
jgi:hypothetical protein